VGDILANGLWIPYLGFCAFLLACLTQEIDAKEKSGG